MAISASSGAYDSIVRGGPGKSVFEDGKAAVSSASTWNQGDFLYLDTTAHVMKSVTATGNAATILGVADCSVTAGKLVGPYDGLTAVNASSQSPGFTGPKYGVVSNKTLKTADAFNIGDKVYLADGLDAQSVSSTDPGDHNYVGIFQGPSTVASAAAGQQGQILIISAYPAVSY